MVKKVRRLVTLGLAPTALQAFAHITGETGKQHVLWHVDWLLIGVLSCLAYVYWRGLRALPTPRLENIKLCKRRQSYFIAAWLTLVVALASPVDAMGEVLFSAHMVQHELILLVAAPLLILSKPVSAMMRGLPRVAALAVGKLLKNTNVAGVWRLLVSAPSAWFIHALGLWGWHLPGLFNAGLRSNSVHVIQHISFLLIALIFWYGMINSRQSHPAAAVVYLFTTAIHASLLGALMTFSPTVWYSPYLATTWQWGLSPLTDQQLGGLIMWMPAGIVFIVAALILMLQVLRGAHASPDKFRVELKCL
jgi:cytochrome c oxidase assembly factor CtaG